MVSSTFYDLRQIRDEEKGQLIVSSDIPLKRAIALRGSGRLAPYVP